MSARFGRNALFQALNYANDPYFLKRRSSKALMTRHRRSHEKSMARRFITLRTAAIQVVVVFPERPFYWHFIN